MMRRGSYGVLVLGLSWLGGLAAASAQLNEVSLPGGTVIHTTERVVGQVRHVRSPGSQYQVHLWQESTDGGETTSFYAVSLAGQRLLGRVRVADYTLHLDGHGRDPLGDGGDVANKGLGIPENLRANPENRLVLVQMVASPLPGWRVRLEEQGARILRFLPQHTYLVDVEAGRLAAVEGLAFVRWTGPLQPFFRLEPALRQRLGLHKSDVDASAEGASRARYSILLASRGETTQGRLRDTIEALGGTVELVDAGGLRLEATLTDEQLLAVAHANEVQFIDRWGGPGESDLDVVRRVGGANYVEAHEGWAGEGVRGEIFDTELRLDHQEWGRSPILHSEGWESPRSHGTSCFSALFSQGLRRSTRGLIPRGQGIFFRHSEATQFGGTISRYDINRQLTHPAGPYRAVFQSSSVGSQRTTQYTTLSAEVDDYLFRHPILSIQSQSNAGSRLSRPQAWAKNIVSVGGIRHRDSDKRCDDSWDGSASIGPAADGRVKPDLIYFNDSIHTADGGATSAYTQFSGTSAATPVTAGHFGLLFQMWHEGVWEGHGGGEDVFASRPQMATAKALMINTAYRYNWTLSGHCTYDDVDRFKQGWGTSDLERLLRRAPLTSVIDETDPILPLEVKRYPVQVLPDRKELNVTLVYTDPMGMAGAARARVNDLSLRVYDPEGTAFWGNFGLEEGNFSQPGGHPNEVDTVENVFIRRPMAGEWTVEILADEVVQDSHLETSRLDADFALVVSGGVISPCMATCGNGVLECGERCDGTDLGTLDCDGLSCGEGYWQCNRTCDGWLFKGPFEPPIDLP